MDPTLVDTWQQALAPESESAQREEACQRILQGLATLPPDEQFSFLLPAVGSGLLPVELRPHLRQLQQDWELLESRLVESLLLPLPDYASSVRGALRITAELATSDARLIADLAGFLARPDYAVDARTALAELTGRQFQTLPQFQTWWTGAQDLGREVWLETALAERIARELADWRSWIQNDADVSTLLRGLRHDHHEIRSLAVSALDRLDPAGLEESVRLGIAAAVRDALETEAVVEQRLALLALAPRYLQGYEALNPLLRAVRLGNEQEKLPAARALKLLQPPEVAWEGILAGLEEVYPPSAEVPSGQIEVRTALWSGLSSLAANGVSLGPELLELRLEQALAVENDPSVRGHIYSAVGRSAGASFLPKLEPLVIDQAAEAADRSRALVAMTAIAERLGATGPLETLLPALLVDAESQLRMQAIEGLRQLKLEGAPALLASRLLRETEVSLLQRMLAVLEEQAAAGALEPLLAYRPPPSVRESYGRALVTQVGADLGAFDRAYEHLLVQYDRELAFRLVRAFPLEGLSPEQTARLNRTHATAMAEFLIAAGLENGNSSFATDAVGRLQDLITAEPQTWVWRDYLVEVQLMRGEVAPALAVLHPLIEMADPPLQRKWELGLDALRFSAASELWEEGSRLLAALEAAGDPPPEQRFFADQVRSRFPVPAPEEPAESPTEGEEQPAEEGEAQGEPSTPMVLQDLPEM